MANRTTEVKSKFAAHNRVVVACLEDGKCHDAFEVEGKRSSVAKSEQLAHSILQAVDLRLSSEQEALERSMVAPCKMNV